MKLLKGTEEAERAVVHALADIQAAMQKINTQPPQVAAQIIAKLVVQLQELEEHMEEVKIPNSPEPQKA